jgi:branched-chain amino acid transport system permease protein
VSVTAEPDVTGGVTAADAEPAEAAPIGVSARPPRSPIRAFWPIVVTGAALALVPLWLGDSRLLMALAVDALAFGAYAVAFNVIFGSTNQLFLCVGALAGLGGYTSAILTDEAGLPLAAGLALATALATTVGGLLSWVAVRRSLGVIFTGIVTLAFSLSFSNLVL